MAMNNVFYVGKRNIGKSFKYSFSIVKKDTAYYLYITFLHIAKDNVSMFKFDNFYEALTFIDVWIGRKKERKREEIIKTLKVMAKHDFKKVCIKPRHNRQSNFSMLAKEVVKPFRQNNVLSCINKKIKLKDIVDLPKEDIVDFLKMHFL